jgi:ribosomal protein L44E
MGQHYTLATVEVSAWCNKCNKHTPHSVAYKRLQFCIPCWKNLEKTKQPAIQEQAKQASLFQ